MNGPVGLDLKAVEIAMDHLNINKEERSEFWPLLNKMYRHILGLQTEEIKKQQKQNSKK